mgnify:CR=1 FL=1
MPQAATAALATAGRVLAGSDAPTLGLLAQVESVLGGVKLLLIWGLVMWASAAVSQLIARTAYEANEP